MEWDRASARPTNLVVACRWRSRSALDAQRSVLERPAHRNPRRRIHDRRVVRYGLVTDEEALGAESETDVKGFLRSEQPVVIEHHSDGRAGRATGVLRVVIGCTDARDADAAAKGEALKRFGIRVIAKLHVTREVVEIAVGNVRAPVRSAETQGG